MVRPGTGHQEEIGKLGRNLGGRPAHARLRKRCQDKEENTEEEGENVFQHTATPFPCPHYSLARTHHWHRWGWAMRTDWWTSPWWRWCWLVLAVAAEYCWPNNSYCSWLSPPLLTLILQHILLTGFKWQLWTQMTPTISDRLTDRFHNINFLSRFSLLAWIKAYEACKIKSTDQEMIPARIATHAHAQHFVATTRPDSIRTVHPLTTRYRHASCFQSVAHTYSSPVASSPPHRATHAHATCNYYVLPAITVNKLGNVHKAWHTLRVPLVTASRF